MSTATRVQPEVGMGATYSIGGDSYPYTIVSVVNGKDGQPSIIEVRACDYQAAADSNFYGQQKYTYTEREGGPVKAWKWDAKNNCWRSVTKRENGRLVWSGPARGAGHLSVGERRAKFDPHF